MNIITMAERRSPRRVSVVAALLISLVVGAGCTYHYSFDRRPSYEAVVQARNLDATQKGPIALEWSPVSFPDRIDIIGPSGSEGSGRSAEIPTGVALSQRTAELLHAAIGVSSSAGVTLTIEVGEARSEYRYAQTFILNRHIDWAQCTLDATFRCEGRTWNQRFIARAAKSDTGLKGSALLERVWDEIALDVVKSIVANLPDSLAVVPVKEVAPPAAAPA
ncbi:MAG: hypothetical protein ACYTG7_18220, partial [Planctomycetota bacterium]